MTISTPVRTGATTYYSNVTLSQSPQGFTGGDVRLTGARMTRFTGSGTNWRLDFQALRTAEPGAAYAIPCPERRQSGNWVLAPVPLINGGG